MPWNPKVFGAVCAGLRKSANEGQFVPYHWVSHVESNDDGGHCMYGCGWGLVGWFAAVMIGGADWAKLVLPVDATQTQVNQILKLVGLTEDEIAAMEPQAVWTVFDNELSATYNDHSSDWYAYIRKSQQLAEFFIDVLSTIPVDQEVPKSVPYAVMQTPPKITAPKGPLIELMEAA